MKNTLKLLAVFFFCAFISCQKEFSDTNNDPGNPQGYDAEAKKFFDISGINDVTQQVAIDSFVKQLKDSALWPKFMAIYPMVGGTANTTKWNLKDPRNSDDAYRLTFNGAPVFAATGVTFPTTSDWADTHFTDALLTYNDNAISYYSGTQNSVSGYDMGCDDVMAPYNEMAIYYSSDASSWFSFIDYGAVPVNTKGLFMLSATVLNVTRYENGLVKKSGAAPVAGSTGFSILIGTVNNAPAVGQRECSLATIGSGLSDAQALTFYNIVQNLQTALGR